MAISSFALPAQPFWRLHFFHTRMVCPRIETWINRATCRPRRLENPSKLRPDYLFNGET